MQLLKEVREVLGTRVTVEVAAYDETRASAAIVRAFEECERIEAEYSRFIEGNQLAALNASLGSWAEVSTELFGLIAFGERVRELSGGAFDLSVKSILEGWGYDSDYSLAEAAAGACGAIEMDDGHVKLSAQIDLGGLGKGYAIDRMLSKMDGLSNLCIDAGGDIFARGLNADHKPWKIAFEHPSDPEKAIGTVNVDGFALASSSPLRRAWRDRHHLVDPKSAEPAGGMLAVYTQADAALIADAYSTALFAMGYEEAKNALPALPIEAMLVAPDGRVWQSDGFKGELL
jgi:thiamine biosynthesis lipoprotein